MLDQSFDETEMRAKPHVIVDNRVQSNFVERAHTFDPSDRDRHVESYKPMHNDAASMSHYLQSPSVDERPLGQSHPTYDEVEYLNTGKEYGANVK